MSRFINYLIYGRNWLWLHCLISLLCDWEMMAKMDKWFRDELERCDITHRMDEVPQFTQLIPKKTMYCEGCPYAGTSEIASTLLGYQSSGYCYYLGKGDYSYIRSTDILWDGCKECGVNDDIDWED